MRTMVENCGQMRVEKISGLVVKPGKNLLHAAFQWELSDSDLDMNYILHAVKLK